MTPLIVREIAPGVRAVEMRPFFDIRRHRSHNDSLIEGSPLVVRSDAAPWSYMASFPADQEAFAVPEGVTGFGWLTRVTCDLVEGDAAISYATEDRSRLSGETAMRPGARHLDLLVKEPADAACVMVRRGGEPAATELRISRFDSFCLVEYPAPLLPSPPGIAIRLQSKWSRFYGEPGDDLLERVRFLNFGSFDRPRPMRWLEDLEVVLAPGEQISRALYVSGLYEPCTATVLHRILKEGNTFVDVGANIGLFTMLASRWVGHDGRVLALEPSGREFSRLQHHLRDNRLDNAEAIRTAAGNRNGSALLHVACDHHSGLNTIEDRFVHAGVDEAYAETVPIGRLDDVLPRYGITRVNAMKIDVEGSEHQVIDGARRTLESDRPTLIIELAEGGSESRHAERVSIEAQLRSLDYQFLAIDGETGTLKPVSSLGGPAENFVAGQSDAIAGLYA